MKALRGNAKLIESDILEPRNGATMSKALAVILLTVMVPGIPGEANKTFMAHLSGHQEVIPVKTRAVGHVRFYLKQDGKSLHYSLKVDNLGDVTMVHIHIAPAGSNGPVVVRLYPAGPPPLVKPGKFSGVLTQGTITAKNLVDILEGKPLNALIEDMENGRAYVNVYTKTHPQGELRGQLGPGQSK
jgi:hypothetical protein